MKSFKIVSLSVIICFLSLSCEKVGEKVENYDLFGLDRASEATKIQDEKIRKAREYQRQMKTVQEESYNSPSILGGGQE